MKTKYILIPALLLLAVLLSACGAQASATPTPSSATLSPDSVVAEGRLEPLRGTNLSFNARGVVAQVLVREGDTVKAGDVLAKLSNSGQAEAQVTSAQVAYDDLLRTQDQARGALWTAYLDAQIARGKAEKKWDDLNIRDIENRIEDDKATVEDRQQDVNDRQDDLDKYKNLDKDNSKRKNAEDALDDAIAALHTAQRNLEETIRERDSVRAVYDTALGAEAEAKHQYEISLDGPNADQLSLAKASLDAAKAALSNYVLTAPFDGTVADVNIEAGDQVGTDTRAVSIADTSGWVVKTTDVTELEVVKLAIGQSVTMVPDALPDLTLHGTVTGISHAYLQSGGDILYTVHIQVSDPDPRLMWGMTLETTFIPQP